MCEHPISRITFGQAVIELDDLRLFRIPESMYGCVDCLTLLTWEDVQRVGWEQAALRPVIDMTYDASMHRWEINIVAPSETDHCQLYIHDSGVIEFRGKPLVDADLSKVEAEIASWRKWAGLNV